jgi:poly(beta-D-mannuronate) lyase
MNKVSTMKWAAPVAAMLALAAASAPAQEITPTGSAVTASTHDGNLPQNAVDNNLGTRWSANGDGQWIQFDLGMVRSIGSVSIAWYNGNLRTSTFDIQVSDCCGAWTTVRSATSSGTTNNEQSFDFPDVTGRYVRYLGHGNSVNGWNSLSEVSIFAGGAPPTVTPPPPVTPTPTSPGATPTPTPAPTSTPLPSAVEITPSTATASTHDGNMPQNAVDNSLSTRWSANGDGQWLQVDLGSTRTISYVRVAAYNGNTRQNRFDIQVSGSSTGPWTNALTGGLTSGTTTNEQTFDFPDVTGRYVRYLGHMNTVNTFNSVTEFSVFGSTCATCPTPTPAPATPTPAPTATPGGNWKRANLTNFESYPDPNSEECIRYNGCQWAGQFAFVSGKQTEQWVRDHNIAAVHEKDASVYRLKNLRLRQGTRQIDVTVYDMCSDSDCSGCCTANARENGLNFLIDIEKYTMQRFGSGEGIVDFLLLN